MPLRLKGVTLVELLIVVGVVGILAALVLLMLNPREQIARSKDSSRVARISKLGTALESYSTFHGSYPANDSSWETSLVQTGDLKQTSADVSGNRQCTDNLANGYCYVNQGTNAFVYTYVESTSEATKCQGGQGGQNSNVYYVYDTDTRQMCIKCGTYTGECGVSVEQPTPTTPQPVNVLLNPSFETNSGGYPANWQPRANAFWDNTIAHTGVASMHVAGPTAVTYSFQGVTLQPSTTYTLNVWAKTQNITGSGLSTRYVQTSPTGAIYGTSSVSGTSDWARVSTTFTTGAGGSSGRVDVLWIVSNSEIGWFDDVALCVGTLPCN